MTVELERKFYKWYKRINISCDEQKTTNRWDGIQNAVGLFENLVDISGLLKIYYRLSFDVSIKDQFVECFATEDKDFPFMDRADYFVGVLDGEMINNISHDVTSIIAEMSGETNGY